MQSCYNHLQPFLILFLFTFSNFPPLHISLQTDWPVRCSSTSCVPASGLSASCFTSLKYSSLRYLHVSLKWLHSEIFWDHLLLPHIACLLLLQRLSSSNLIYLDYFVHPPVTCKLHKRQYIFFFCSALGYKPNVGMEYLEHKRNDFE